MRYFEDYEVGQSREYGGYHVTEAEIIEFASKYDPQWFHTDPERAKSSIYGGLIASGWHTTAMLMRMNVDGNVGQAASLGSPGVDEVRWLKPVRPGDTLRVRSTVTELAPSRSKPDRGVVKSFTEVLNQNGEVVMTTRGMVMIGRRPNPGLTKQ
jgi:acyl dehydratase